MTPHYGPTNRKLRLQVPLVVPENGECVLRVDNQRITLKEGVPFVFDDSFEHEAWNHSEKECRIVLIVDFWHPDLAPREVKFFSYLRNAQLRQSKRALSTEKDSFYSVIEKAYRSNSSDPNAVWNNS